MIAHTHNWEIIGAPNPWKRWRLPCKESGWPGYRCLRCARIERWGFLTPRIWVQATEWLRWWFLKMGTLEESHVWNMKSSVAGGYVEQTWVHAPKLGEWNQGAHLGLFRTCVITEL